MEGLTQKEMLWYDEFVFFCERYDRRYVITSQMSKKTGVPTKSINYHLSKLAAKGILRKVPRVNETSFYYAEDFE